MVEPSAIEAELLGFLRREIFAPEAVVTSETDLVAAGFDSMSLVRLLLFIETKYGLWIPESKITNEALLNPSALATTLSGLLHEP